MEIVYIYALFSNLSFALGTQVFTHYSRSISSNWMNAFKATVGLVGYFLTIIIFTGWHDISLSSSAFFLISGFIGLGIGDMFLLKSFSDLGPGRTLIVFGLHPLIVGSISYIIFGQEIGPRKFIAIIFFILCLLTFAREQFKATKSFQFRGLTYALIGVSLDACGVILTRAAFDNSPAVSGFEGNFYRALGAVSFYLILSRFKPLHFTQNFLKQTIKGRGMVIIGSILGTYLSLATYLLAVKSGNLATISAISITGSIFSSILECIIDKKWPTKYLMIAFFFFLFGFYFTNW